MKIFLAIVGIVIGGTIIVYLIVPIIMILIFIVLPIYVLIAVRSKRRKKPLGIFPYIRNYKE